MTELLPCPFCNGPARLKHGGPGNWFAQCDCCMAATNDVGYEHAIDLWNRRSPSSEQSVTPAELVQALRVERERCAKIAEKHFDATRPSHFEWAGRQIAEAIRAPVGCSPERGERS